MPFLAPVFAAISTFAASSVLAGFAVKIGTSLLLSAAASALTPKPKLPSQSSAALQGRDVTIRQAVASCELVYGRARKGGVIVFLHSQASLGEPTLNELHMVIVFASHQVRSIGNIYFDGELAIPAGWFEGAGRFSRACNVVRANGAPDQTAFPDMPAAVPGLWTAQHRLRGQAAIWIRLYHYPDIYPSGIPNITADIEGKNDILDPRSGLRGYSENAALCVADYMSMPEFGTGGPVGGVDGIAMAALITSANVCDEVVAVAGGVSESRYTCNGVISLSELPKNIIEGMLTAMAGTCAYASGQWSIYAGYYRWPTVTIAADDVREGGLTLITRQSRARNFNAVRGTFISPENDWVPDDFPAYVSAAYVAEDGGEVTYSDIALPFTISASAAQRLAKIELERMRRQQTVEIAGKLACWRVGIGDSVMLSYDRWGFAAKPFEVSGLSLDLSAADGGAQILPMLTLRETSPLVYDWSASEERIYAAAPRTNLPSAFDIPPPGPISVTERLYETRAGDGVKAAALLTWQPSPSGFVAQYQVEGRIGVAAFQVLGRTDAVDFDILDIAQGRWDFRVKAISQTGVSSDWSMARLYIFALSVPPQQLTNVTAQVANGLVVLNWDQSRDPDVRIGGRIEIRHSTSGVPDINRTYSIANAPGAAAQIVLPQLPGTYFVRAVDSVGTVGPATYLDVSGATAVAFAAVQTLQADPTFTGTRVMTELIGSALRLSALSAVSGWALVSGIDRVGSAGGFAPEGRFDFATGMNLGSLRRLRLRSVIAVASENPADLISLRFGNVSQWERVSGGGGGEIDVVVEVRTTATNPTGSPVWGAWSRLDSNEIEAWGVQARAFLRTRDASFTPVVSQLRVIAEEVI